MAIDSAEKPLRRKKIMISMLIVFSLAALAFYFTCTIFVIQPIGALPEGRTIIMSRLTNTNFIDSADAICLRRQGYVNLLCRGGVFGALAENSDIYLRLPFSQTLYDISIAISRE